MSRPQARRDQSEMLMMLGGGSGLRVSVNQDLPNNGCCDVTMLWQGLVSWLADRLHIYLDVRNDWAASPR